MSETVKHPIFGTDAEWHEWLAKERQDLKSQLVEAFTKGFVQGIENHRKYSSIKELGHE